MHLREVTIRGFKSFAHTTAFQIDEGLTAIIGPNGSGKSNFTEAIRWVLGEQSLKNLRGRKSDDVIFAGSTAHTRAGAATVTLMFSNEDGRIPLNSPEVAVTRRLTRAGESEYLLNGDPVRLLDVQQLLAEAGMGTKSYTVISQGMVDRYLTAAPAARRELFDEACGIKPLQLKVARAQRQLTQARSETQALYVIQQELEPRLRLLRRQATRYQERAALEQTFQITQAQWLHYRWQTCQTALAKAETAANDAHAALALAREKRNVVEQELLALASQPHGETDATRTQLQQRVTQEEREYEQLRTQFIAQKQAHHDLSESLRAIRTQLARAETELTKARSETEQHSLLQKIPRLLARCDAALKRLLQGEGPDAKEAEALRTDIADVLQDTASDSGMVTTAQALVQRLEGPLQAVARLQALEQDRVRRLEQWKTMEAPASAPLAAARAALQHYDHTSPTHATRSHEQRLTEAREQELAAERGDARADSVREQVTHTLQEVQSTILRERGSEFLEHIKHTAPTGESPTTDELHAVTARLAALGEIDPLALKEYEEVEARYKKVSEQLEDIEATAAKIQQLITTVTQEMHTQFRKQFSIIKLAFTRYFAQLFEGGDAQLTIVDATPDPTDLSNALPAEHVPIEGVEIFVHPPGKKLQHVHLLSGGEKALTSLALLLAILEVQQPPFLVLDEVDAALDEANSHRFASLLKAKSVTTQCIVISHNRETMAQAHVLYGITMQRDGVSKVYSVKLHELVGDSSPEEMRI